MSILAQTSIDHPIDPRKLSGGEAWPLYTSAQVKAIDQCAIAQGTPATQLMLRAARVVVQAMMQRWSNRRSAIIFTGAGNNGGDGYLVAKLLREQAWTVTVIDLAASKYIATSAESVSGLGVSKESLSDAEEARNAMLSVGIEPIAIEGAELAKLFSRFERAIIVDAMLGIGLRTAPRLSYQNAIEAINECSLPVVAVDVPSGLCSDSGVVYNTAVQADLTVSFIALKRGLFTGDAVDYCGDVLFHGLGVAKDHYPDVSPTASFLAPLSLINKLPVREKNGYKHQSGHVLVIGGDHGMAGAPLLSAGAALRLGAGLVSVATRSDHAAVCVQRQPELMARGIDDNQTLLGMLDNADVVLIGPGLGLGSWSEQLLKMTLESVTSRNIPLVVDADALTLIARNKPLQQQLTVHANSVLTPHSGEAGRLLGEASDASLILDRFAVAGELAEHYVCTLVLKGAGTIIDSGALVAGSEREIRQQLCPFGNPVLATAGTGDVLAGAIAAFIARGMSNSAAAQLAVALHACAADGWAQQHGGEGFVASDLWVQMPLMLNQWMTQP